MSSSASAASTPAHRASAASRRSSAARWRASARATVAISLLLRVPRRRAAPGPTRRGPTPRSAAARSSSTRYASQASVSSVTACWAAACSSSCTVAKARSGRAAPRNRRAARSRTARRGGDAGSERLARRAVPHRAVAEPDERGRGVRQAQPARLDRVGHGPDRDRGARHRRGCRRRHHVGPPPIRCERPGLGVEVGAARLRGRLAELRQRPGQLQPGVPPPAEQLLDRGPGAARAERPPVGVRVTHRRQALGEVDEGGPDLRGPSRRRPGTSSCGHARPRATTGPRGYPQGAGRSRVRPGSAGRLGVDRQPPARPECARTCSSSPR